MEGLVNPAVEFWRDRRVLVTGHTGFKGSWQTLWLHELGAQVTGLALEPLTTPSLFALACDESIVRSVIADVRDLEAVLAIIAEARPEIVFHLAAQSLVRPSYQDPVGTYATNVMGTVHLLEAVRRIGGVRAVVNVTSDKCYENREWLWPYREYEAMGGHDPYSSSKGCAELVTSAYRRSFFHPGMAGTSGTAIASGRAGNVIGGGDWASDRIVPDAIRAFAGVQPVPVRSPASIRPWQHVLEPLAGYLLLAERLSQDGAAHAEAWNFGPGEQDARPVSYIADALTRLWGDGVTWKAVSTPKPHEATYLKVDASKARARLGWHQRLTVDQALAWTVDWYRRQATGASARDLCVEQIRQYQSLTSAS